MVRGLVKSRPQCEKGSAGGIGSKVWPMTDGGGEVSIVSNQQNGWVPIILPKVSSYSSGGDMSSLLM